MTPKNQSEFDSSTEQEDGDSVVFETVEDKALEALKHDNRKEDSKVTVSVHNRDHDSDRNVTDHLIKTNEEWIAFSTWSEPGAGTGIAVDDHGETLQLEAPDLDDDLLADRICSEALDAIEAYAEVGEPVKPFTVLVRNIEDVTENLVTRWQDASEYLVSERVHEGMAGWTGYTAWISHEGEAIFIEVERAVTWFIDKHLTGDVSDDIEATIHDIFLQSLHDVVDDERGRRTPHLEFAARVTLTD